jgi:AAA15 family ATPase/GTPase
MIKDIEIVEYKGFKNLKLDNLSQINIISGENNIGKTALLEALFLYKNVYDNDLYTIFGILLSLQPFLPIAKNRDITKNRIKNYLKNICYLVKTNDIDININYKSSYQLTKEEKKYVKEKFNQDYTDFIVCYINKNLDILAIDNENLENFYNNDYINSSKPTNKELVKLYSNIQSKGIQHKFLTYLKLLDDDIEWIEPQLLDNEMLLRINLKNPERSLVSSELGEGTNRYIEILATLLSNSNGTVFIDEVENGIHYRKLYDVWRAIIEIVQKEKIQLFVTTHDRESIEALSEASRDVNFNQISSVKLEKDKNNVIFPIILNHDSFLATVDSGMDIR